jgi:hypothetical protein
LTEGAGIPIGIAVDGANRNDFKLARETLESITIDRPAPTRCKTQGLCLDKGYDYDEVRELADEFRYTPTFVPVEKRPRPSSEVRDSRRGVGWWNGYTAG